jgi:hypothetical protein
MRVDRGRLNFGVFFIVLGAVPLAYHQGWIDAGTIGGLWRLWPLILIGLGLGLVLSRTPAYFVGGLFVAACLGLIAGSLFAVGPHWGCDRNATLYQQAETSGSSQVSRLDLTLPCGEASISRSPDSSWRVSASHAGGRDARINLNGSLLSIRADDDRDWWVERGWNTWNIQLPAETLESLSATTDAGDATLDITGVSFSGADFTLNAGSFHLDLNGASLASLSLTTNAGASRVRLDSASDIYSGSVTTNAGELTLCVPFEVGLQIRSTETLGSSNLDKIGLARLGDTWQTQNYSSATHKVNLSATTNAGNLNVKIGGC